MRYVIGQPEPLDSSNVLGNATASIGWKTHAVPINLQAEHDLLRTWGNHSGFRTMDDELMRAQEISYPMNQANGYLSIESIGGRENEIVRIAGIHEPEGVAKRGDVLVQ
nr:hypothetical protein [Nonomuraea polychroma]